jgi:uncharacterized damage-inducible protein DinB
MPEIVTPDYARLMARYNRWQNESLYGAAQTLPDAERRRERGAFFGSIHATLSHLLWGDGVWMARFSGSEKPPGGIADSGALYADWDDLCTRRRAMDAHIAAWAEALDPAWLAGDLTWFSGAAGREISKPAGFLVAHLFNHQTHHRGQVHAMLTAAGAKPGDTDLFYLA